MINVLPRINELAAIEKTVGLNTAQLAERAELRAQYLQAIRGQVVANMQSIKVVTALGQDVTPEKLVEAKAGSLFS